MRKAKPTAQRKLQPAKRRPQPKDAARRKSAATELRELLERMDRKMTELEAQADRLLLTRRRA